MADFVLLLEFACVADCQTWGPKTPHQHEDPTNHNFLYLPYIGPWNQNVRSLFFTNLMKYYIISYKIHYTIVATIRTLMFMWSFGPLKQALSGEAFSCLALRLRDILGGQKRSRLTGVQELGSSIYTYTHTYLYIYIYICMHTYIHTYFRGLGLLSSLGLKAEGFGFTRSGSTQCCVYALNLCPSSAKRSHVFFFFSSDSFHLADAIWNLL